MLSERIKNLIPYVPGEQPQDRQYIKLNTNENPYPPCPGVKSFLESFDYSNLRLYPDPLAERVREKIAGYYHVEKENVFVGNGSDEVLSFAFYAFFDSARGPLLFPEFTYSFYPVYCNFYRIDYNGIGLNDDFSIDIERFLSQRPSCGLIFPNPNAPTGIFLDLQSVNDLLRGYPRDNVVIIDEAYIDFGGQSAVNLISEYKNLLVTGTFSKSRSLAGLRFGFAVGSPGLIRALFTVKDSFNSYPVDYLAQRISEIAIEEDAYYKKTTASIISTRDLLVHALTEAGWHVLPSRANFIFTGKKGISGESVYRTLKQEGILVRYFNIPGIDGFVRITIGTDPQIGRLLDEIKRLF
ncbi:MAG: histidinol-phosphate transaminase [Spirochaetales bacterium]|nr:histidinol-phosphate transaminase [Spirochaetales bacterium]